MIKILVVDDEADIREILSFNLSAAGYQVIEADSGEAAMLLIQQGEAPDLILLDVMLPGISGFKLTAGGSVAIDGQELALSRKEFEILLLLASEPGRSFSRNEILQQVWGAVPYVLERTVDVHIARIRAKLGEKRALVQNRQGFGYSLELDREV